MGYFIKLNLNLFLEKYFKYKKLIQIINASFFSRSLFFFNSLKYFYEIISISLKNNLIIKMYLRYKNNKYNNKFTIIVIKIISKFIKYLFNDYLRVTVNVHWLDASPPELMATTLYTPASSKKASWMTKEHLSPWNNSWKSADSFTGWSSWYQITCPNRFTNFLL